MKLKSILQRVTAFTMMVIFFTACGGGGVSSNQYLGDLPGIANKYYFDAEEKEDAASETTNMEKAFKYARQAESLEEEGEEKIEKAFESGTFENIPFNNLEGGDLTVKSVKVSNASSLQSLQVEIVAVVNKDLVSEYGNPKREAFLYYNVLDKDGNVIEDSKTVAMNMKRVKDGIKEGMELKMSGTLKPLYNLTDFDKIQVITEEAYQGD